MVLNWRGLIDLPSHTRRCPLGGTCAQVGAVYWREEGKSSWLASCFGEWELNSVDRAWPCQLDSPSSHYFNRRKRHLLLLGRKGREEGSRAEKGGRWSLDYGGMWFPRVLQQSFCGFLCVGVIERHSAFFHAYTNVIPAYLVFIAFII